MLAYAAHRRPRRRPSPATLSLIVGGHAVALAFLITARMEVNPFVPKTPIIVDAIPLPTDPPPLPKPQPEVETAPQQQPSVITPTPPRYPPLASNPVVESGPPTTDVVPDIRPIIETPLGPVVEPLPPISEPVKVAARLATPPDLLRPPYPDAKRRSEEEAVLRLRLGIDARGRVVSVDPVGEADAEFLSAARRHLIRTWRYKPATEDGRPVATTITITLRFELRDV